MKKTRIVIFIVFVVLLIVNKEHLLHAFSNSSLNIEGNAAILIDAESGEVLFAKNEQQKIYPASTTKLLTALVVLEHSEPDESVIVGEEVHFRTEGEARAGLFEGQVLTVEQLLSAMLLQSGNDAARTLATHIAEKVNDQKLATAIALDTFAQLMNQKAKEIGAHNSQFVNPHGLHDEGHYSTAEDIVKIALAAKGHDMIEKIVSLPSYTTDTHTYTNRNQLLNPHSDYYYEYATGLKTGFTSQAGYCLASSAEKDGTKVIAVVVQSGKEAIWSDSLALLEYGLEM